MEIREEVRRLMRLARVAVTDREAETLTDDLEKIVRMTQSVSTAVCPIVEERTVCGAQRADRAEAFPSDWPLLACLDENGFLPLERLQKQSKLEE